MKAQKSKIDQVIEHQQIQEEALQFFVQGDLKKFDALVGEEACQIRALMIVDLYKKYADSISSDTFSKEMLTEEENIFLLLTYFLTKFAEQEQSQKFPCRINLQKIMDFLQVQKNNAELTRHEAQVKVAELSVGYLFLLLDTKLRSFENMRPLLQQKYLTCGRPMVGCYIAMMLMYYNAYENNHPILIRVARECNGQSKTINQIYRPNLQKKYAYTQQTTANTPNLKNYPILVIEGKSTCINQTCSGCFEHEEFLHKLKKNIEKYDQGLLRILCANAAQHGQFVGKENIDYDFSQTPEIEQAYAKSKEIAEQEGYSLKNPSTFLIQHIYATTYAKEIIADTIS